MREPAAWPGLPALASLERVAERKEEGMAVKPIPDQYHSLQPYLLVEEAPRLVEFLKATFDAEDLGSMPTPEGKIGHAEMRVGDTIVMLADASTAEGVSGPMPATVVAYVEDCDEVYQPALEAGGETLRA